MAKLSEENTAPPAWLVRRTGGAVRQKNGVQAWVFRAGAGASASGLGKGV